MSLKIINTEDNSPTIWNEEINEHYHSTYGAIRESLHVFINAGLNFIEESDSINLLEIGMGTGLNIGLTAISAFENQRKINCDTLEKFPLTAEISSQFVDLIEDKNLKSILQKLHQCKWNESFQLNEYLILNKIHCDVLNFIPLKNYNLIYFDAFNPNSQPELWTEDVFRTLFESLNWDGVLVTYCAKGYVKRNLKAVGFAIESLPGPKGKREMTRAIKRKSNKI